MLGGGGLGSLRRAVATSVAKASDGPLVSTAWGPVEGGEASPAEPPGGAARRAILRKPCPRPRHRRRRCSAARAPRRGGRRARLDARGGRLRRLRPGGPRGGLRPADRARRRGRRRLLQRPSSARLAALYPESGGTYVYGRRRLGPFWGYLAGWGFVVGKTASCAAMALTFGAYAAPRPRAARRVAAVAALTALNALGVQQSAS